MQSRPSSKLRPDISLPIFVLAGKSSFAALMDKSFAQEVLASMFIGTTISFILQGVTCCQVIWYFRFQSGRSSKCMKCLILFIWLGQTLGCIFMLCATLHTFLAPAIARAEVGRNPCRYWAGAAQKMASQFSTLSVEGFFIVRMWRFSGKRKLTALAFFPYIIGNVMGLAQIVNSIRQLCNPSATSSNPVVVFMSFGFRLLADSVTVLAMCYMLYVRSLGFMQRTNTIKIVRGLILWTISTGMLTWLNTVLIMACNINISILPDPSGLYYVRTGLYANAMLAQLNARTRFRAMADATIPRSINLDTMLSGQQVIPDSRPGNGSVLNPTSHDGSPIQT